MKKTTKIKNFYQKYHKKLGNIIVIKDENIIIKRKLSTKIFNFFISSLLIFLGVFIFFMIPDLYAKGKFIEILGAVFFLILFIYQGLDNLYKYFVYYVFDIKFGIISKYFLGKKINFQNFSNINFLINENKLVNYVPVSKNYIINFKDASSYELASFGNKKTLVIFSELMQIILDSDNSDEKTNIESENFVSEEIINNEVEVKREVIYYQNKIKKSNKSIILTSIVAIIFSILLGVIYSTVNYYFHFYLIAILLPLLLGSFIGIMNSFLMKKFNSNNSKDTIKISIISSIVSIYASWICILKLKELINTIFLSPIHLFNEIINYSSKTTYNFMGFNFTNNILFLFWFIELLSIIYLSYSRTKIEMKKDLLCNECNNWFDKIQLKFDVVEKNILKKELEKGDFSILKRITDFQKYLRLTIYICPNCVKNRVLDAVNIKTSDDNSAKIAGYIEKDVENLVITQKEVDNIFFIYNNIYDLN